MKKIFLFFIFFIIVIMYLIYNDYSFSPLTDNDFRKIFSQYNGKISKSCGKDLLGFSIRGERFEIYLYNTKGARIDTSLPRLSNWENKETTNESVIGKWKKCPLDSIVMQLYAFTLDSKNYDQFKCSKSFKKEMTNPRNYYSYIHFNELEQYFLLFITDKQQLFYIRRRGF